MARKKQIKRRKSPPPEHLYYLMAIETWHWEMSFGINGGPARKDDPFSDHRHLQLSGRLIHPGDTKSEHMQVRLIPGTDLEEGQRDQYRPNAVGQLSIRDDQIGGLFSMPMSALPPVITALSSGHLKYAAFWGPRMRYRRSGILSYRLMPEFDAEEFAPELLHERPGK